MSDEKPLVKIRFRQVITHRPTYGRFDEYQVVQSRKVLSRHDLREQAEKWINDNGYKLDPRP